MRIHVEREIGAFGDVWPTVSQLAGLHGYVFQARDVLEVWLETIGAARGTLPLLVRVDSDDGSPLMLLPLGIERRTGVRMLSFLDGGVSDYNAPILFPAAERLDADAMRRLWARLIDQLPPFDVALIEKVPALVGTMQNPFRFIATRPDRAAGHLVDISELAAKRNGKAASRIIDFQDTRRKRRKLESQHAVSLAVARTADEASRMLETMIRQKTQRYMETRGVNIFERPGYGTYFGALTTRLLGEDGVQLAALMAGEHAIATHWGIVARDRFYYLMPAFEAGPWSPFSPGSLLLEELLDWSARHGIQVFDLGVGDEAYKLRFANATLPLFFGGFPRTTAGRVYLASMEARRSLAKGMIGDAWRGMRRQVGRIVGRA
jgi:CelD/BcsL family acetyltransferase involved in cellulose biosynthesis